VKNRIHAIQAAWLHKPTLIAAVVKRRPCRRSAEQADGGGNCNREENPFSTHFSLRLFCGPEIIWPLRETTTERLAILPAVPGNFSFVGSHAFAERWAAALPARCAGIRRGTEFDELGGIGVRPMCDHAMMIPSREHLETVGFRSDHRGLLNTNEFARFSDADYVLFSGADLVRARGLTGHSKVAANVITIFPCEKKSPSWRQRNPKAKREE
jgi:hypothetical protein